MTFWLGVTALAALGAILLLVPALRRPGQPVADATASDHLRRFEELDADLASGDVAAEVGPALRDELERAVLSALPASAARAPEAPRPARGLLWLCALAVPAVALAVYLHLGSPRVAQFQARHPALALSEPRNALELLLGEVRDRVAAVPDDREAWEVLTRASMQLGRYDDAVVAAEKLQTLAPRDTGILLMLVDALAMRAGGELAGRPLGIIDDILAIEPGNVSALVLSGIAREKAGDRPAAVAAWQRALAAMPPDEPLRAELQAMIEGRAPASPVDGAAAAEPASVAVEVEVTLDAGLTARAAAGDTLFVVARAVGGPAAPLAVSRHRADELPLSLTLDERMAMVPGTSLADFDKVEVIARISRNGQPLASAGDLEGRSAAFNPRDTGIVSVLIDDVVEADANAP